MTLTNVEKPTTYRPRSRHLFLCMICGSPLSCRTALPRFPQLWKEQYKWQDLRQRFKSNMPYDFEDSLMLLLCWLRMSHTKSKHWCRTDCKSKENNLEDGSFEYHTSNHKKTSFCDLAGVSGESNGEGVKAEGAQHIIWRNKSLWKPVFELWSGSHRR